MFPYFDGRRTQQFLNREKTTKVIVIILFNGGGTTWTGDLKCREVKTGFCRKRLMLTGSSETLIAWKSGNATYVPLWDRMEGAWLWTRKKKALKNDPGGWGDVYVQYGAINVLSRMGIKLRMVILSINKAYFCKMFENFLFCACALKVSRNRFYCMTIINE